MFEGITKVLVGATIASVTIAPKENCDDEALSIEFSLSNGHCVCIIPGSVDDENIMWIGTTKPVARPGLKTVRDLHYNYGSAYGENATIVFSNRVAVVVCFTMGDTPYSVSASRRGESIFEYWDITESHANVLLAELQQMSK